MSDSLFNAALGRDAPQLHVLLVGVSEYRHLPGVPEFDPARSAKRTFGLGQLTSPRLSASELADWFLTKHNNPDTPLGSVELLLSPAEYTPNAAAATKLGIAPESSVTVPLASFDALREATDRWFDRLNALRENIGLFYFCGHGLEASDRYLLAADFAADPKNLDQGIINFQQTFRNMARCKASTQCYLLDACRDSPDQLRVAASEGKVGRPIIDPRPGPVLGRNAPIYHAAAPEKPAFGPPGEKSFFARALLDCMNGMAARAGGDPQFFSIDHASLGQALPEYVDRLAEEHGLELRCLTDGGDAQLPDLPELHRAPAPVDVLTKIFCRPREAHAVAQLSVTDVGGKITPRPVTGPKPWRVTLRSGKHTVSATFAKDVGFSEERTEITVVPTPIFSVPVPIRQRDPNDVNASGDSSI
ncbi:MAG TPA: hypothetical protein VI670_27940 [Thermoanaerobaculia bacterium]|jgi:hypothetical protein